MKNVTVSLDDATYRQARRRAAEADRSLSAVVREFLSVYGAEESEFDRLARLEEETRALIAAKYPDLGSTDILSRAELYDPDRVRQERRDAW